MLLKNRNEQRYHIADPLLHFLSGHWNPDPKHVGRAGGRQRRPSFRKIENGLAIVTVDDCGGTGAFSPLKIFDLHRVSCPDVSGKSVA